MEIADEKFMENELFHWGNLTQKLSNRIKFIDWNRIGNKEIDLELSFFEGVNFFILQTILLPLEKDFFEGTHQSVLNFVSFCLFSQLKF